MAPRQIKIVAYNSHGTVHNLYLKGRVVEDMGVKSATADDTAWDNLVNMYKRFFGAKVPYAHVRTRFQRVVCDFVADQDGYFEACIEPPQPLPDDRLWHEIELELVAPVREGAKPMRTMASVLVPPQDAQFAVISDIDDTVIHTDAVSMLRMARTVVLGNARSRLPLPGVAVFFRALFCGTGPKGSNPLFYVSNSPWNLYDLLCEFFELHDIPIGPVLFLRHWGITRREQLPTRRRGHKLKCARSILETFPNLPFILIGDSGEEDPEIYVELVRQYPNRIRAIYIRNISRNLRRLAEIEILAERVLQAGSTLILADSTLPFAQHAAQLGWIAPTWLAEIDAEERR